MHEHIAPAVYFLEVHLVYASIVCVAAWFVTSLWNGKATWKYWIWVATSLNFIIPCGGLFDGFGTAPISWARQLSGLDEIGIGISRHLTVAYLLFGIWLSGAAFMLARLVLRIRCDSRDAPAEFTPESWPLKHQLITYGVPVRLSTVGEGPFVGGVFRSYISLPQAVNRMLSETELEAVLIHEATHARRRDNLIHLLHELTLCGMWFHPLVWLTGVRLTLFRELSCDDSVIASARGADLVCALAKLAVAEEPGMAGSAEATSALASPVRSRAASLLGQRVARLTGSELPRINPAVDWLLIAAFVGVFLLCVLGTIAHYPGCFKV